MTAMRNDCRSRCGGSSRCETIRRGTFRRGTFRQDLGTAPRVAGAMGGWSLVEVLVAAGLGLSLAALALRAYVAGSAAQNEVTAELRLHEAARYAFHTLGRSIRLAGFPGCLGEANETSPFSADWQGPAAFAPVQGWNRLHPHPDFGVEANGEIIALWWSAAGCGANGARVPPELRPPPNESVGSGLRGSLFYPGRRGNDPDNPAALFLRELSTSGDAGPAVELVEGLESIRFAYRMSAATGFLSAEQVQDWTEVRSVRIDLDLRSTLVPALQRSFSQTVALRNRPLAPADFPQVEWPATESPQPPEA